LTAISNSRHALIAIVVFAFTAPRAAGLIEMNEGRDKVTVTAGYGISYDSNLYAHSGSAGDVDQSLSLGANYTRSAGMIGFSSSASVTSARFHRFSSEDYTNPSLTIGFAKNDGRLTGSLSLTGQRESRSEDAANIRANSWHYSSDLGLRYPVNARYYLTSLSDISIRDYTQNTPLYNLSSYAESVDLYYVYSSKLDLLGGYRIRIGQAQGGSGTQDSAFTLGATGGILPKLSGTMRAGYQWRYEDGIDGGNYHSLTTAFSLAWPIDRRITLSFQTSKDFMTAATDVTVDATAFDLSATIKPNLRVKIAFTADAGYTISQYLGRRGAGREDRTLSLIAHLSIPIKSHFAASLSYGYYSNDSNIAFSKYERNTASFDMSLHY
jgi:hypothetical protein